MIGVHPPTSWELRHFAAALMRAVAVAQLSGAHLSCEVLETVPQIFLSSFPVTFNRKVTLLHIFHSAGGGGAQYSLWSQECPMAGVKKYFTLYKTLHFELGLQKIRSSSSRDPCFLQAAAGRCWHSFNTVGWLLWWGWECCGWGAATWDAPVDAATNTHLAVTAKLTLDDTLFIPIYDQYHIIYVMCMLAHTDFGNQEMVRLLSQTLPPMVINQHQQQGRDQSKTCSSYQYHFELRKTNKK